MNTDLYLDHPEEVESHGDHADNPEPRLRDIPLTIQILARFPVLAIIRLWQIVFSSSLPVNTCRFTPSCSHYGYQAVYKYGAIKGSIMAAWRIIRCNPFNRGDTYDPVP
jgi:putative membrane protein insertion efficiency factor